MPLYCGIDLHSNNHVICVIDDKDNRVFEQKLGNHAELTIGALKRALMGQIKRLEKSILKQVEPTPGFDRLKTASGIGDILAETILLETPRE